MTDKIKQLKQYIMDLQMTEHNFRMLKEFAISDLSSDKPREEKPISKKDVIHNEIHNSNIGKKFQEDIIDNLDDYDVFDGSYESSCM